MDKHNLWSVESVWNASIAQKQKELKPRNYIYPGDIGKNYYERYLKMNAVPPDKTYEDRVLRKFTAGLWFEEQIGYVFKTIGILQASQKQIEIPETEDHLRISGRLDYVAGGQENWQEAKENVRKAGFPEFIETTSYNLIDYFAKSYPEGLEKVIIEVKSVNSQVFWAKKDYLEEAYPHHVMQLFTYLKAENIAKGVILYVSKDDLTIKEQLVLRDDPRLEAKWQEDVRTMSAYYRQQKEPPKPEDVIFDPRKKLTFQLNKEKRVIQGCYVDNWEVKWSNYFTQITGCKDEDQWMSKIKPIIAQKNLGLKELYIKNNSN